MTQRILIVDDEQLFAKAVGKKLDRSGYRCDFATTLREAQANLDRRLPDLMLLDMRLPDGSGLDFLRRHGARLPATVVMTAYADIEDAVTAMKYGARDYLTKPVDLDRLLIVLEGALGAARAGASAPRVESSDAVAAPRAPELLGDSPALHALREQLTRIAELAGRARETPPTVMLTGETGTGKDLVARWLHAHSPRHDQPFVQVDCAALPRDLIETELFGHERGAFTGAQSERQGLIETAGEGTVLLDEIGELPPELQAKLLAVLERRRLRRVGSTRERPANAWFIAATHRDLKARVQAGEFRADLYYRLQVLSIALPALRERTGDIPLLAQHFARQAAQRYDLPQPVFAADTLDTLRRYRWPGNVRELKNTIERAVLLSGSRELEAGLLLPEEPVESAPAATSDLDLERTEIELIRRALEATDGNISAAARRLGITRMTLRYRMQKYAIEPPH